MLFSIVVNIQKLGGNAKKAQTFLVAHKKTTKIFQTSREFAEISYLSDEGPINCLGIPICPPKLYFISGFGVTNDVDLQPSKTGLLTMVLYF